MINWQRNVFFVLRAVGHRNRPIATLNISAKTEYACIAVLELAANYGTGQPVQVRRIADSHGIPSRFLVQILLQLKGAGMVASTRGAAGGYQLIKSPDEITLGEVMAVVEGPPARLASSTTTETPSSRVLQGAWREVAQVQQQMLRSLTFSELVDRVQEQSEDMYYI